MNKLTILAGALLAGFIFSGCVKKAFDTPPDTSKVDPGVPQGTMLISIAQLKGMNGTYAYLNGGDTTVVTQDVSIAAIVTADDRSGNFYKTINIEDSTGGMQLAIDAFSLYNAYPVGRKIYVKCKGLTLGYNGGTPVLGMGVDEQMGVQAINGGEIESHIIKAATGNVVTPRVVTLAQLTASGASLDRTLLNRLVTIEGVQFVDSIGVRTYSQPNGTTNRDIRDCSGKKIVARTSNYANFAAILLPAGGGSITGVFSIFTSSFTGSVSPQLTLRDTGDVKLYGARCGGGTGGGGGTTAPIISVDSVRKMFSGTGIKLGSFRVTGTVITDATNKNVSTGNFIIQNGNRGLNIYVGSSGSIPALGDSVIVDISGDSLKKFAGMMEVDGKTTTSVVKVASNVPVAPRTVTIAMLTANFTEYEATLVRVVNATITGGGTYSGNKTLDDGTGTIILRTGTTALFASQAVPATSKSFTGVAGWFNTTKQILLRNPNIDVQ